MNWTTFVKWAVAHAGEIWELTESALRRAVPKVQWRINLLQEKLNKELARLRAGEMNAKNYVKASAIGLALWVLDVIITRYGESDDEGFDYGGLAAA